MTELRLHSGSGLMVSGMLARSHNADRVVGQRFVRALKYWWQQQSVLDIEDEVLASGRGRVSIRIVLPLVLPVLSVLGILVWLEPHNQVALISTVYATAVIVYAMVADVLERRLSRSFWLHIASAAIYALVITALLLTFVTLAHPRPHTHWVVFFLYFLLIGSMGLSDDPRQAICAGMFSAVGYLCVVVMLHRAAAGGSLMAMSLTSEFEWVSNACKLGLLSATTFLAVTSASRGRSLRRSNLSDGLTHLFNRHAFDHCLGLIARRSQGPGSRMTIAMIDLDHFKRINDSHGHAVGDAVLRWTASWLKRSFRSSDLVARYGGEEFVVAFPDSDCERIEDRLDFLRHGFDRSTVRHGPDGPAIRVTISVGIARMPEDGATPEEVLARADERLYEAKRQGRNCVVG